MALAAVNIRSKWRPYWIECQTPWPRWESSSNIAKMSFSLLFFLLIQILLKRILLLLSSRPLDDNPLQSFSLFSKLDLLVPLNFEILYRKKSIFLGNHLKPFWMFSIFLPFPAIHTSLPSVLDQFISHYSSAYNVQNRNWMITESMKSERQLTGFTKTKNLTKDTGTSC